MNHAGLKIVFAGTPAFTLPCLDALWTSKHLLQAIFTQPDRPAGRGRKLQASAVKLWAEQHQIPIYQPLNFKTAEPIDELQALAPDLMIVIAYGLILPQRVLDIPRLGCINVHASLLPELRGAAPIQYALLTGAKETGITIMQMDSGMDTGAILAQTKCPIEPQDNSQTLHDRLAAIAPTPLLSTLDELVAQRIKPKAQNNSAATYAHKITKAQARIVWQQSVQHIDQQIRAYIPWPIAYTQTADGHMLRIHQAKIATTAPHPAPPGTILALDKQGILVNTGRGQLQIERLQSSGAKVLAVADWLNSGKPSLKVNSVLE